MEDLELYLPLAKQHFIALAICTCMAELCAKLANDGTQIEESGFFGMSESNINLGETENRVLILTYSSRLLISHYITEHNTLHQDIYNRVSCPNISGTSTRI